MLYVCLHTNILCVPLLTVSRYVCRRTVTPYVQAVSFSRSRCGLGFGFVFLEIWCVGEITAVTIGLLVSAVSAASNIGFGFFEILPQ